MRLLRHNFTRRTWLCIGLVLLVVAGFVLIRLKFTKLSDVPLTRLGITFSTVYARSLGLDPIEVYAALTEEMSVRAVRLPIYWSDVERQPGEYDWSTYDALVRHSEEMHVALTVATGTKAPRWPECYVPDWAEGKDELQQSLEARAFIQAVVERYQDSPALERWQIENEPLFPFGICSYQLSLEELQTRIDLVRSLDTHPVQLTVSGELGPWKHLAERADVLGLSLYRKTWNRVFGYFVYPLRPWFYHLRADLVRSSVGQVIISELQAEPWFAKPFDTYTTEEAYQLFTAEELEQNVTFAKEAGVSEAYVWGAEWWYRLKQHGENRLWNTAKQLFESN